MAKTNIPNSELPRSNSVESALKEQMKSGSVTTMRTGKDAKGSNVK